MSSRLFHAVHPDDLPRVQRALRDHFDGHRPEYSAELRVATKDGRWVWIVQRGKVFARDEHGRPLRMAGTSLDITRRKRIEMEQQFLAEVGPVLHKSLVVEDTLSALADLVVKHLADYCVIDLVEDSGEIRRAKVSCSLEKKRELAEEFARLPLGGQRTPILLQVLEGGTKLLFETVAPADLEEWALNEEHLRLLRESRGPLALVGAPAGTGPDPGWLLPRFSHARPAIRSGRSAARRGARPPRLALPRQRTPVPRGRTSHRRPRRGARRRRSRSAQSARDHHDAGEPSYGVVSATPRARARKASERIERATERMKRLIQDLLDVTRVEAGQLALERAPLRTRDVAVEAVDAQKTLAASFSIELRLDLAEHLPDVFADRHRMLQVFENLIGNAIKFTPTGGRITLGVVPQADSVLCYVRDTGRGIPAEELPHLFDRFWQPRRSREETRSGAGLGLPIVKGIVEAHGGRIWVESAPGEGSTFYFTIPTRAPKEIGHAAAEHPVD